MIQQGLKQALLITSNVVSKPTLNLYHKLAEVTDQYGDVFLLIHNNDDLERNFNLPGINVEFFSDDILKDLCYKPIFDTLLPGSNHFAVLYFFLKHPEYQYYWCIENDVEFSGSWVEFFKKITPALNYDFITSHIRKFSKIPDWLWWKTFNDSKKTDFKENELFRSFNPIYRISHQALRYIDSCLKEGYSGHHEVLYPSLIHRGGFSMADLGTEDNKLTPVLHFCTLTTMRWKPIYFFAGFNKNKLYHPVKAKVSFTQFLAFVKRNLMNNTRYVT